MYEINTAAYNPSNFFAGDYPVAKESIEVTPGETITKHGLVKFIDGKASPLVYIAESPAVSETTTPAKTAEENTFAGLYGIAAESADGREGGVHVVVYLTGEFFESAIELPEDVTIEMAKPALRKIGIFIK